MTHPIRPGEPRVKDTLEIDLWFNIGDNVRIRPECAKKILLHNDWAVGMDLTILTFNVVGNEKGEFVQYTVQCADRHHPAHADRKAYISESHLYEVEPND